MERISKFRAAVFLAAFVAILTWFSLTLFKLQVIEGNADNTTTYTSLTRVKASRGDILDRNGVLLVGNRASYDLVFNHYVIISTDDTNEYLYDLVKKCEELGVEYNDHFPVTATRPFSYTLDDYSSTWRGYFQSYLKNSEIDSDISAALLVQRLRTAYSIPDDWTDEEARAVIGLRYEFDLRGVIYTLSNYVFIEDVSDENLSAILELNTPGLMVESSTVREYYTTYAAHILGYVAAMDSDQWAEYKELGYAMDAYVGQTGFELAFEEELHATDGTRVDVVDKDGTLISQYYANEYDDNGNVIGVQSPQAGNNVETTLDIRLQQVAEDELAAIMEYLTDPEQNVNADGTPGDGQDAQGAAVVVMEVKTGQILACASYPTYNLSTMHEDWEDLLDNDLNPLYNRALSAVYPPGSTYKMCTLTAAINAGLINSETLITDEGIFTKYDFNRTCLLYSSNYATHGDLDGATALEVSCNYFFYVLGDMLTIDQLDSTAKGFGLGESTGVELAENVGWRANAESKAAQYTGLNAGWFTGDKILAAIGQSENRFSPLQLCVYATTLANKGTRMKATFLSRVVSSDYTTLVYDNEPVVMSTMEISDDAYYSYMTGMQQVVTGSRGTARAYFNGPNDSDQAFIQGISVCAKTGTAETFSSVSDNGAFLCFAPAEDPVVAVYVYGERVAHGSTLGAVAEAILQAYFTNLANDGSVTVYENQIG